METVGNNPITGQAYANSVLANERPVAIMINNIRRATPQVGLGAADLLYELEVEGKITRQMAVFANAGDVPEIGSIRSLRHDFIDLAGAFDAIVVHFGGSDPAYQQLKVQMTDHIDSSNASSAFWRDSVWRRLRGYEHSVKTTAANLVQAISRLKIRTGNLRGSQSWFLFQPDQEVVPAAGSAATFVSAPFSTYNTATFSYIPESKVYTKGQFSAAQKDVATGQPLQFTNVLLLKATVTSFNGSILREYDLTAGTGYYLSGGQIEPINWKKGATSDPWIFTRPDGQELVLNRGKTYIGISSDQTTVTWQ
jgi:hypothetical protein